MKAFEARFLGMFHAKSYYNWMISHRVIQNVKGGLFETNLITILNTRALGE